MTEVLPISLCMFVKNEESNLRDAIESVRPIVSEIIIVDTGSTDNTVKLARSITDRVYEVPFTDFGSIRTLTAHLASCPWVLMLDGDERIDPADWPKLAELVQTPMGVHEHDGEWDEDGNVAIDSWAFPRKRWADAWMRKQVDVESYPDWQVRFFLNHIYRNKITFRRRVHETISGAVRTEQCPDGPTIHHFQNLEKSDTDLLNRQLLYTKLHALDLADGVEHSEPPVVEIDKVK
jgi:glycosyltransferase involved in cell wall biosynthesis